jgi:hypothetical protein
MDTQDGTSNAEGAGGVEPAERSGAAERARGRHERSLRSES